jgi:hypothetical protein
MESAQPAPVHPRRPREIVFGRSFCLRGRLSRTESQNQNVLKMRDSAHKLRSCCSAGKPVSATTSDLAMTSRHHYEMLCGIYSATFWTG